MQDTVLICCELQMDNVVNPDVPWLDKPGLAYKAFKGKFVYGIGEGNPWRQEDQGANARDILQSSTLPELADNVTSMLDKKAEKMRMAMDRIKEDPTIQKVQKFSAAAKKVTGRGVDAAFMLVVSKAEQKAPPPPAPRPKKGLDAKRKASTTNHWIVPTRHITERPFSC
jgi:hypothetical protein